MATKLGAQAKIYLDTGTYTAPTWVEIKEVADVTLNGDPVEVDVSSRGSITLGLKATVTIVNDVSVDFQLICDEADPNYIAIRQAFTGFTPLYMAALTGPLSTTGVWGIEWLFTVTKFTNGQPLLDKQTVDVTLKPAPYAPSPPVSPWVSF